MDTRTLSLWRRFRLAVASLPIHHRASLRPVFFYRDVGQGDGERGARLTAGRFSFDHRDYSFSLKDGWHGAWPADVRKWLYGFSWLRDLKALETNEARLCARGFIHAWCEQPPSDELAQDGYLMGQRLANWLGHYEFCLETATESTQKQVLEVMLREGRILAALLPLPPQGWQGLAALRGLLAAFMVLPEQQGFLLRFQRYLKPELERLILADGTVAERSPEAQFQTVRELQNFVAMYNAMEVSIPFLIMQALEKTCPVLNAFCHGDGKLAIFNGSLERTREEIQALFENTGRYKAVPTILPQGGFARITLGRSLLLIDAGKPPAFGFDNMAHAGTLSFEFSYGMQRLFVNCGAAKGGAWKEALRASAAHNALTAEGESCVEFGADGHISRHPSHVSHNHKSTAKAHWIDLSHDGYHAPLGAIWSRSLYLGKEGEDLRGQELVEGERDLSCTLRFHIYPTVKVEQEDDDVMLHAEGSLWRFRQSGGDLTIEKDLYLGKGLPEPAFQIVLTAKEGEVVKNDSGKIQHRQKIIWVLERVPD
ncbi:heparinase II/III family protein [Acetobacteraceae bacterium ESL0709]|nr:heparinase II/III family protein [Acetobacteraceae bacterium ESL0697]MDF7677242.1 heparinase II/III family protein [Acetobacteraceae bacterium ESL0709]